MSDPAVPATPAAPADLAGILRPLRRVRQVRDFTSQPVDHDALLAIANVGRWTGSSNNGQPWRFLLLEDPGLLRRIHDAGLPQTRAFASATAAIAVVLPSDPEREIRDTYDDGRAAERLLIAAAFLGLGAAITWVRADVRDAFGDLLGLPADRYVRTIVAIGHPTDAAKLPRSAPGQARLPRDQVVFEGRWPA
jgi:nitroreductase